MGILMKCSKLARFTTRLCRRKHLPKTRSPRPSAQALHPKEISSTTTAPKHDAGLTVKADRSSTGQSIIADDEILGAIVTATMWILSVKS